MRITSARIRLNEYAGTEMVTAEVYHGDNSEDWLYTKVIFETELAPREEATRQARQWMSDNCVVELKEIPQ